MKEHFIGPLFQGIDDPVTLDKYLMPRHKTCIAGEHIDLRLGDQWFFAVVISGCIQCSYGVFTEGQCFGLCSALTGIQSGEYVAKTRSQLALLPGSIFSPSSDLPDSLKQLLMSNAMRLLAQELSAERLRTRLLSVHGISQRLIAYLEHLYLQTGSPYLTIPFNRNQLAQYLAVSRPSMSRALCQLRNSGLLEFDGSSIKLLDHQQLFLRKG